MTRRFWLSFCDYEKTAGECFLGVAIIEVTDDEAAAILPFIERQFPNRQPGAEWIAAATRKAHLLGCNPGGEIATADITDWPLSDDVPRHTLLSKDELTRHHLLE